MRIEDLKIEAEECRRQAAAVFHGRPEAVLLLRLASTFDELSWHPANRSLNDAVKRSPCKF